MAATQQATSPSYVLGYKDPSPQTPKLISTKKHDGADQSSPCDQNDFPISAAKGTGLDALKTAILETLQKRWMMAAQARQEAEAAYGTD